MEILSQYLNLCRFKGNLVDKPRSIKFFQISLIINIVAGYFIEANITDFLDAFIQVALQTILVFVLVFILLFYIKSLNLFIQVVTAFLVCENVLYIIGVPLMVWVTMTDEIVVYFILAAVLFWGMLINAYIVRQLLFFSKGMCLFLSISYYLLVYIGAFMISSIIV